MSKLVLKFQKADESELQVRGAARIRMDGRGNLTIYDADSGAAETVQMSQIHQLSIEPLPPLR